MIAAARLDSAWETAYSLKCTPLTPHVGSWKVHLGLADCGWMEGALGRNAPDYETP